jgi:hypothetical protein
MSASELKANTGRTQVAEQERGAPGRSLPDSGIAECAHYLPEYFWISSDELDGIALKYLFFKGWRDFLDCIRWLLVPRAGIEPALP